MRRTMALMVSVLADGLAPLGARPSAGTVMTKLWPPYMHRAATVSASKTQA